MAGDGLPEIAGLTAAPALVPYGSLIALTASGVTGGGGTAILDVRFHIDADNDGQLTTLDGSPLAVDADGSNGWAATVTSLLSSGGPQRFFAVATDTAGRETAPIAATATILLAPQVIDNGGAGYSVTSSSYWSTSGGGFGGGHQFEFGATGGYAMWTFSNLPAGEYLVSATWLEGTNRGTKVPYSIADGSLNVATVAVNQRVAPAADTVVNSKNFQNLASVSAVHGSIVVRMTNNSGDGRAIADAIRIQQIAAVQQTSEIRVFDGGVELADAASTVNLGTTFFGTPSATKTLTVQNVGLADLVLSSLTQANMPAGITLVSSYANTTLARGQSTTFQVRLSAASTGAVSGNLSIVSNDPDQGSFEVPVSGVVDAAKVIDNTSSTGYRTVSSGYWSTSGGGFGGGHQFEFGGTGGYAEWTFGNLPAGEYRVFATWPEGTNRGTKVPYSVSDGSYGLGTVSVNQRLAPTGSVVAGGRNFQSLGSFSSVNGSLVIRVANSSGDGRAIADAVRIEYLGPATQSPEIRVSNGAVELYDSTSTVNLGTTFFGTPADMKTLTVTNSGTTGLVLATLTQQNMPAGVTLVASYASAILAPGASTTFQVRLAGTIPGASSGVLSLASNDPDEASFEITLTGTVDAVKVIENGEAGYSTVSSNYWSTTAGYQFEFGANGGYAEWRYPNLPAGEYRISAAWPDDPAWSSIAPYSILDGDVTVDTVRVNQQLAPEADVVSGGRGFQDIGLVGITHGSLVVRLTHDGPNRVVADAIRVEYVGKLPEVQISDTGAHLLVNSGVAGVLDFGQSERSQKAVEVIAVTNQSSAAISLAPITQADLPAGYFLVAGLGAGTLAPGESAYARLRLDAIAPGTYGGTVPILAGAHSFGLQITGEVIKAPVLVDNGDPEFTATGSGWQNGTSGKGFQDDSLKTSGAASGKGATWTIDGLAAGAYLVYATYLPSSNNTAAAQYNLYDGTQAGGVLEQQGTVNQRLTPDDIVVSGKGFGYIGQINVNHGTLTLELDASSLSGGLAIADAVYVLPATLGTFFGFSSPGDMVTGSSEWIETGFVDPDGELANSINVYSDTNGNRVLDVGVDQLLSSDTAPGDGLHFDVSTLPTGAHRLFVTAMGEDGPVANAAADVTASEWWKVTIRKHRTPNEREFNTEWELTADPKPVKLVADLNQTWVDAVYARVSGTVHTENTWDGQDYYYAFPKRDEPGSPVPPEDPNNKPFDVEIQDILAQRWPKHDRAEPGETKMIVLEDLTRSAFNDFDYDDQYWVVELKPYILDLDVNSDNTAMLDRSKVEEQIEEEPTKPGVIVPVGGARVPLIVELSAEASAQLTLRSGDDKVLLYDAETNGNQALPNGTVRLTAGPGPDSTLWTFWIEANRPSVDMADIVFTLTPQGEDSGSKLIEMIAATAAEVDVVIDDLAPEIEDGSGAVVWRNSDFSRQLPHPVAELAEDGLPHYVPDYRNSAQIDSLYATQFTKAVAKFPGMLSPYFSYQFDGSAASSVVLWTRAAWAGFIAAGDGWFKIPSAVQVTPVPAGSSQIDIWIEGLTSTGASQRTIGFKAVSTSITSPAVAELADDVRFRVIDVGIAVDGNRDGTVDFSDNYDSQLTFWLNNDHEVRIDPWFESEFETEDASKVLAERDNEDGRISTRRDLEDFASLGLNLDDVLNDEGGHFIRSRDVDDLPDPQKPLVRYELKGLTDATSIRLFRQISSKSNSHVKEDVWADLQVDRWNAESGGSSESTITSKVLQSAFTNGWDERSRFLFEGVGSPGKVTLTLTVTVTYPQVASYSDVARTTSRDQAVTLDLREFEDFYTRMRIPYNPGASDDRTATYETGDTELPHFADARRVGRSEIDSAPFLSGNDTVVFVHGWNMTDGTQVESPDTDWKKAFAETAFKRLYWQGFRGNLVAFDWPTFADSEGPIPSTPVYETEALNLSFNASEYQAWRSGRALMHYLASLKSPTGRTHLLGHSMGSIVVAEALRQWFASGHQDELVNTYIAMQAAISAGIYGSNTQGARVGWNWGVGSETDSETDLYRHWPSGDGGSNDDYYMAGTSPAAGKWVNMYNPDDAATAGRTVWPTNNWLKGGRWQGTVWESRYQWTPEDGFQRGYWTTIGTVGGSMRVFISEADLNVGLTVPAVDSGLPQPGPSAYEAMAFLARSEAMPVGTMDMALEGDGRFAINNNFNIQDLGLTEGFIRSWPGHSFQFNFDSATTWLFWEKVREQTGFRSTLS